MADREKVMGGLAALVIFLEEKADSVSMEQSGICYDALTLLEEQEPRLVTHEDFFGPLADDGGAIPCWKESRKPTHRSGWVSIVYGKMLNDAGTARYWTKRPTDEQRRMVSWD